MKNFAFLLVVSSAANAQLYDYPGTASEHGSVRVQLVIGTDGNPTKCTVIRPSNIASLDAATCPLVIQSAHFVPSKDQSGKAVEDTTQLTVHYVVPHVQQTAADLPIRPQEPVMIDSPEREIAQKTHGAHGPGRATPARRLAITGSPHYPPEALARAQQGQVSVLVDVGTNGRPAGCSVIRTSTYPLLDSATCKFALDHFRYRPGTDYLGNSVVDEDLWTATWVLPR